MTPEELRRIHDSLTYGVPPLTRQQGIALWNDLLRYTELRRSVTRLGCLPLPEETEEILRLGPIQPRKRCPECNAVGTVKARFVDCPDDWPDEDGKALISCPACGGAGYQNSDHLIQWTVSYDPDKGMIVENSGENPDEPNTVDLEGRCDHPDCVALERRQWRDRNGVLIVRTCERHKDWGTTRYHESK